MATFTLTINCDNAAFNDPDDDANHTDHLLAQDIEVARILRRVVEELEDHIGFAGGRTLYDLNGNNVGRAAFKAL